MWLVRHDKNDYKTYLAATMLFCRCIEKGQIAEENNEKQDKEKLSRNRVKPLLVM